jgi:hypothetical protein
MPRARRFNPGALHDLDRATVAQVIVPGSTAYDWTHKGGQGNIVPAVGGYPSGAPNGHWGGLSEWLGDNAAAPLSPETSSLLIICGVVGLYWLAHSIGGRK